MLWKVRDLSLNRAKKGYPREPRLQTQLKLPKELNQLNLDNAGKLLSDLIEIQKMIYTFKNKLQS